MRGTQVALLLACFMVGCDDSSVRTPLVGGPCRYAQFPGMFQVVSIEDGKYQLMFELQSARKGMTTSIPLERLNGWKIEMPTTDPSLTDVIIGDRFHAIASVITEGSCTPVNFELGVKAAR